MQDGKLWLLKSGLFSPPRDQRSMLAFLNEGFTNTALDCKESREAFERVCFCGTCRNIIRRFNLRRRSVAQKWALLVESERVHPHPFHGEQAKAWRFDWDLAQSGKITRKRRVQLDMRAAAVAAGYLEATVGPRRSLTSICQRMGARGLGVGGAQK
jgi:hypothetical protein